MSEWIDVKDLRPDRDEPIVYARRYRAGGRWRVGITYWIVSQKWLPELGSLSQPGFTHWKPLGETPEDAGT